MINTVRSVRFTIVGLLLLCATAASFHVALAQQPPQRPDSLQALRQALVEAGAPALSPSQQDQLISLTDAFRAGQRQRAQTPNTTLPTARRAYDEAVVGGMGPIAQSQAIIIADQISSATKANLLAEADFKIKAVNVLKTNMDQVNLLLKRFGTAGFSGVLSRLVLGELGPGIDVASE